MEDRLRACPGVEAAAKSSHGGASLLLEAKQYGFSDRQLGHVWNTTEAEVRRMRQAQSVEATFKLVDTCAAEFEAFTPYYYSSYEAPTRIADKETRRQGDKETDPISLSPCLLVSLSAMRVGAS